MGPPPDPEPPPPLPAPDEPPYWFVFSTGPDLESSPWFAFPAENDETEIDFAWLAGKFDHIGPYWWTLCPEPEEGADLLVGEFL